MQNKQATALSHVRLLLRCHADGKSCSRKELGDKIRRAGACWSCFLPLEQLGIIQSDLIKVSGPLIFGMSLKVTCHMMLIIMMPRVQDGCSDADFAPPCGMDGVMLPVRWSVRAEGW